jgi:hypothetical protein
MEWTADASNALLTQGKRDEIIRGDRAGNLPIARAGGFLVVETQQPHRNAAFTLSTASQTPSRDSPNSR